MPLFRKVKGQERAEELLGRSYRSGRLAHAYLFAGPSGVGRLTAALELAAAWMCRRLEDGYCGECRDCTRIFRFQHPDVRVTVPMMGSTTPEEVADLFQARVDDGVTPLSLPGNTRISIDQIRELEERLSMKAYENRGHIEILLDADRMGVEAANALLKTLEEPPDDTVITLVSSRWSALLPTVRSRAHLVRFRRLEEEMVRNILTSRLDLSPAEAEGLARAADGRPGLALKRAGESLSETDELGPGRVLRKLGECDSASCALSLASKVSTKLRREGSPEFCRLMQSLLHDLRRKDAGMRPLSHSSDAMEGLSLEGDICDLGRELFSRAETRLAGNGMVSIVLGAAFVAMWDAMRKTGKEAV